MANDVSSGDSWRWPLIATEFVILNVFVALVRVMFGLGELELTLLAWNVSYAIALLFCPPVVFRRSVRSEQIAVSVLKVSFWVILFFYTLLNLLHITKMKFFYYVIFAACVFLIILILRLLWRSLIRRWRFSGNDNIRAVFVGSGVSMSALYYDMTDDASMGYHVLGYFEDKPSELLGDRLPRLGTTREVTAWLAKNDVNYLFCNLPSRYDGEIRDIINYCENHLIHFYSVPNVRSYVYHTMRVQIIGSSVVLALRNEPMNSRQARFIKRTFDIVFSLLVILIIMWWLIPIVAIITMLTMPGPIFFKQKRNGLNNKEFDCLKFRTMVVNDDADSLQATKNDERITKWGAFMRRTNIDEFPQFFNVLIGDMSVVGPRPHMLRHNEEYRQLIDKYMVRFYSRPGITGWAQVTGNRGETKTLGDMEQRILKDIWYIENWTFMLDVRIIIQTVINMFGGEKGNAY
ncbi:MAG: undecaprenyl-phosphate glucose phosphotransferase [Prevotella sp.]|nr:undecaprenyl-phosphate glucose phosphotransferase [Prevotella sp.]